MKPISCAVNTDPLYTKYVDFQAGGRTILFNDIKYTEDC